MTTRRFVISLSLVALSQACLASKGPIIALSCPPAALPPAPPTPAPVPKSAEPAVGGGPRVAPLPSQPAGPKLMLDDRGPSIRKPYTLVINNRVAAVVPEGADSLVEQAVWAKLDPSRIKTMELVPVPRAQECNARVLGTLILVTTR